MKNDPKSEHTVWNVEYRVHSCSREGNRSEEYEDAYALPATGSLPFRVALADGATESAYSGAWARKITSGYVTVESANSSDLEGMLTRWREEWQFETHRAGEELPWYAEAKLEEGAFAAFLGMTIFADRTWRAQVIGDCCLFQLRKRKLRKSWPYVAPDQFTSRPDLLSSSADGILPEIHQGKGTWIPDDTFILATDAISQWLLRCGAFDIIHDSDTQFQERIHAARSQGMLRNDDVTLLMLTIIKASEKQL